jgi:tRNA uridine 5-carboxymethylaminomethyl modification enzyme
MEKCIQEQRSPTGEGLATGSSIPLSDKLYGMKLPMGRLKTGTPARIRTSSINLKKLEIATRRKTNTMDVFIQQTKKTPKTTFMLCGKNKPGNA